MQLHETRHRLEDLGADLMREYGDTVPPGRVLTLVYRTHQLLARCPGLSPETRLSACEDLVRKMLDAPPGYRPPYARIRVD